MIDRRLIKWFPKNPRTMDQTARKRLRENIQKVGLLGGLVFNTQTGHLLSGHQRLAVLDQLEGTLDYKVEVTCVNLTEAEEAAQVVFFNNPSAQGQWDLDLLAEIMRDPGIDRLATGFDDTEIKNLLGFDPVLGGDFAKPSAEVQEEIDTLTEIQDAGNEANRAARAELKEARARHQAARNNASDNDRDFYLVMVFPSIEAREAFKKEALGLGERYAGERYIDPSVIGDRLGWRWNTVRGRGERIDDATPAAPAQTPPAESGRPSPDAP